MITPKILEHSNANGKKLKNYLNPLSESRKHILFLPLLMGRSYAEISSGNERNLRSYG